jgi:hypothetical protein
LGLLKQFRLRSMGTPVISEPPGMADFDNQDLLGVELFDALEATLASALDVAPNEVSLTGRAGASTVEIIGFGTAPANEPPGTDCKQSSWWEPPPNPAPEPPGRVEDGLQPLDGEQHLGRPRARGPARSTACAAAAARRSG